MLDMIVEIMARIKVRFVVALIRCLTMVSNVLIIKGLK